MVHSESRQLNLLVAANVLGSIAHFADNAMRFALYPEPRWISGPTVVIALWMAITPLLLAGWCLARRRHFGLASLAFWVYAFLSLFVIGHYSYAPATALPRSIHVGIAANALAALALLLGGPSVLRGMRRSGSGPAA